MKKEIRIHGRGGQGVVALAEILAIAFFYNGKEVQAFPHFGVERSGAPIQSFVRVSDQPILSREHVYEPDILIILDDTLLGRVDILAGIKINSKIIINSSRSSSELEKILKSLSTIRIKSENIYAVPATAVALEVFGRKMVNTIVLAALTQVPGLINMKSVKQAVKEKFLEKGENVVQKNFLAMDKIIKVIK